MHLPQVHKEVADQRHGEQGGRTGCKLRQQGIQAEDQAEIEIYRGSWLVAMMINVILMIYFIWPIDYNNAEERAESDRHLFPQT